MNGGWIQIIVGYASASPQRPRQRWTSPYSARQKASILSFVLEGVHTTIPFLLQVLDHPDFVAGNVDTKFLERIVL